MMIVNRKFTRILKIWFVLDKKINIRIMESMFILMNDILFLFRENWTYLEVNDIMLIICKLD